MGLSDNNICKNKMKHMVITNNKKRNDGNEYNTGIMC